MQNALANLEITTPSEREVRMTRTFDAPRPLVFEAWTKPDLLKRWMYGPDDWWLAVCELDFRVGGRLRFEWHSPDGGVIGMSGVYKEIVPPERIVQTELFDEDWTGGETLVTVEFTEHEGRTTVAMTVLYVSPEARDGALQTGMAEGLNMGYDRLAALLPTLG